jgi:hypothetical protein
MQATLETFIKPFVTAVNSTRNELPFIIPPDSLPLALVRRIRNLKRTNFRGYLEMRRSMAVELSPEDRLLARRWAITSASLWAIVIAIIAAVLASSTADKAAIAAKSGPTSEQRDLVQDRSGPRLYGSLPNMAPAIPNCAASQPCLSLKATGVGGVN